MVQCVISHRVQLNLLRETHTTQSVKYISFVLLYAVQFKTGDFHTGSHIKKKSYENWLRTFRIRFPGFNSFEIKYVWKMEVIFNTNFNMSSVIYILCGMTVKLAMRLGSDLFWPSYTKTAHFPSPCFGKSHTVFGGWVWFHHQVTSRYILTVVLLVFLLAKDKSCDMFLRNILLPLRFPVSPRSLNASQKEVRLW